MSRDVVADQFPAAMLDNHKHVHQTKGCRGRHEEIAGNDPRACRRRKVDQRKSTLARPRGRRGRYLLMVQGDTRIPSFSSNTLAIRSPHDGFSFAIRRISARNSAGIGGRPDRDFILQNSLQPARCQRISVAGLTTVSASRQSNRSDKKLRPIRVATSIRRGLMPLPCRAPTAEARTDSRPG